MAYILHKEVTLSSGSTVTEYVPIPPSLAKARIQAVRATFQGVKSSMNSSIALALKKSSTTVNTVNLGAAASISDGMIKTGSPNQSSDNYNKIFDSTDPVKIVQSAAAGAARAVDLYIEFSPFGQPDT